MTQEIIVFVLFALVLGYKLYSIFIKKGGSSGGCEKCAEFRQSPATKSAHQHKMAK